MRGDTSFQKDFLIMGGDFTRAGKVSCEIKNLLKELGHSFHVVRRVAIAAYEAEMNAIMYARKGRFDLLITPNKIQMTVEDEGPGINDIDLAMREGYSTATKEMRELGFGAGMGLPNIKKNSDRFVITSEPDRGTRLEMTILTNGEGLQ